MISTVHKILQPPDILPPCTAQRNTFMTLNSENTAHGSSYPLFHDPPLSSLSNFKLAVISGFIHKSESSTCWLDSLPTLLANACLSFLSCVITDIIHCFIISVSLKTAATNSVLKRKTGADTNNLNNCHPVSN